MLELLKAFSMCYHNKLHLKSKNMSYNKKKYLDDLQS